MRLLVIFVMVVMLSGCSAMLIGGSAESDKRNDCTEQEKEAEKRGC